MQDPWAMPSIDLDFCLIAIRVATYGESMEVGTDCPHCNASNSYDINLLEWMQVFNNFTFVDTIDIDPLIVHIRPYNYKEITKTSIKTLEQQRLFAVINDEQISDEEKLDRFGKSFVKITELTVDIIADCITQIETPNGASVDKTQIKEFINNCSKDVFEKIQQHIAGLREQIELKAKDVKCGECEKEFSLPITMDQSNFFAVRS
jgi:CDP-diacylglycerol pyrophosphatase